MSTHKTEIIMDERALRSKHYNAVVTDRIDIHDDLMRISVRPDVWPESIEAGQYVTLGLGRWEPRVGGCGEEADVSADPDQMAKVVRRAYSISCPIFSLCDDCDSKQSCDSTPAARSVSTCDSANRRRLAGPVQPIRHGDSLEFYVVLVRQTDEQAGRPAELTPRLFRLAIGDRLQIGKKVVGHYKLDGVENDDTVLMIGTGTGEAPHNAMAAALIDRGHRGDIVHVTTVRSSSDLGYAAEHRELMRRHPNYKYVALTTRDRINTDPDDPNYVGKRYIQDAFASGWLAEEVNNPLDPKSTHVFLCGNPAMIGYSPPGAPPLSSPGMIQVLTAAGFHHFDGAGEVGHGLGAIRFEKYW